LFGGNAVFLVVAVDNFTICLPVFRAEFGAPEPGFSILNAHNFAIRIHEQALFGKPIL